MKLPTALLIGLALAIGFIIGIAVATTMSRMEWQSKTIGTLREDKSDPDEPPYLFMELDRDGFEKIHKHQQVLLNVKIEDYIPRK